MVFQHIQWMPTQEQKIKMAMKQAGFWGAMVASLLTVHNLAFWAPRRSVLQPLLAFIAAGAYPVMGYLGMRKLGHMLYPHKADNVNVNGNITRTQETPPVNVQKILQKPLQQTELPQGYPVTSTYPNVNYPYNEQYPNYPYPYFMNQQ